MSVSLLIGHAHPFDGDEFDLHCPLAANETDLDALLAELTGVIQETLEPESISIWLKRQ